RDLIVTGVQTCALPIFLLPVDEVDGCGDLGVAGAGRDEAGKAPVHGAGDRRVARVVADVEEFVQVVLAQCGRVDEAAGQYGAHRSEERRVGKEWRARWG